MSGRTSWLDDYVPYLLDFPHIPAPYCYRCPYGQEYPDCHLTCADELERVIHQEGSEYISAFIAEPIQTAGAIVPIAIAGLVLCGAALSLGPVVYRTVEAVQMLLVALIVGVM